MRFLKALNSPAGILCVLLASALTAFLLPEAAESLEIAGVLFVNALKSIGPLLGFFAVFSAVFKSRKSQKSIGKNMGMLFGVSLASASFLGAFAAFIFHPALPASGFEPAVFPASLGSSSTNILQNLCAALVNGNYLSLILWGAGLGVGLGFPKGEEVGKKMEKLSEIVFRGAGNLLLLLPFGVFGLLCSLFRQSKDGIPEEFLGYLSVMMGALLIMLLVIEPLIYFFFSGRNPGRSLWRCLKKSAPMAFLTRSSVANIPVNLELGKSLGIRRGILEMGVPVAATIHMPGAALILSVLTIASLNSCGIPVRPSDCILIGTLGMLGGLCAAGIPSGATLMLPVCLSFFGLNQETAFYFMSLGLMMGVFQDSLGTAVNSASDILLLDALEAKLSKASSA